METTAAPLETTAATLRRSNPASNSLVPHRHAHAALGVAVLAADRALPLACHQEAEQPPHVFILSCSGAATGSSQPILPPVTSSASAASASRMIARNASLRILSCSTNRIAIEPIQIAPSMVFGRATYAFHLSPS